MKGSGNSPRIADSAGARTETLRWTLGDTLVSLGLLVLPFLFFWPLWVSGDGGRILASGDFFDQFYAFASFEVERFAAGQLPLWNPYAYAGAPFWADIQAAVAYPPSLLIALGSATFWGKLPFVWLEFESVAHLGLAAFFTYLFARRHLGCRGGALTAAIAFGLGGYATGYPMLQLAVLETAVWLPLALLGVERLFDDAGPRLGGLRRFKPDPVLALALGLAVLAGHPQTALHLVYATIAYFAWRWIASERIRIDTDTDTDTDTDSDTDQDQDIGARRSATIGRFVGSSVLGAGLSAAGWLPGLEFLMLSNRAEASYEMLANGFPPAELLGMALPGLTLWSPLYLGLVPLLLALGAAGRALARPASCVDPSDAAAAPSDAAASPNTRFWILLALMALLLSLGRNGFLFDLFYLMAPAFDLFRGQERAAFLFSFALAMLAGEGMMRLRREGAEDLRKVMVGAGALLAMLGLVLAISAGTRMQPAALRLVFLAGATLGLVLFPRFRSDGSTSAPAPAPAPAGLSVPQRFSPRALQLPLLLLLTLSDLFIANANTNLEVGPPEELRISPSLSALSVAATQRVQNEDRLPRNFGMVHGLKAISGSSPLRLRDFEALRAGLEAEHEVRFWDLMAVSHVLSWREELPIEALELVSEAGPEGETRLFYLEAGGPRAWRAPRALVVADDNEVLARLRDPDFDLYGTVLLAEGEGNEGLVEGYNGGLSGVSSEPGYAHALVQGDGESWLVFSEIHYPGWRAYIDGEPAPVLRANLALVAVPVPAGEHRVEIRFEAPLVQWGIGISLVALLGLVLLIGLAWASARRRKAVGA